MGSTVFPAAGGGVTQKISEFTSTGTFVTPSNVTAVEVFLVAGGGGGGFTENNGTIRACGAGGGGGQVIRRSIPVTAGASYTVTIGAGGAAGTGTTTAGGNGSNTSFGSLATAYGGGGAQSGANYSGVFSASTKGGGGPSTTNNANGGCGAGAGGPAISVANSGGTDFTNRPVTLGQTTTTPSPGGGINIATIGNQDTVAYAAGVGIDGYGNGGSGSYQYRSTSFAQAVGRVTWSGTGYPAFFDSDTNTRTDGVAPTANTGDGGHGGITTNVVSTGTGTAGASGFARVVYWS